MRKQIILLISVFAAVTLLISGCAAKSPQTSSPASIGIQIGNLAPDFQLQTLDGKSVSLSGLRGKPVLLNFWATWCGPCKSEMPFLQQINDSWSDKGLVLLAVDVGENPTAIANFMNQLNLSLTVPMDLDLKVARNYGISAIPATFLIDKDGIIQGKVLGAFVSKEAIETQLGKIVPP
jgi:thiol-disulfide isomerase/thioredoxin